MNIFIPKSQFRFLQSGNNFFLIVADCIDITKIKPICQVVAFVLLQTVIRSQISEEKTNHSFMKRGCGGVKDRSVFSWKFIQFAEYSRVGTYFHLTLCTDCDYLFHRNAFFKVKGYVFLLSKHRIKCTTNISITIYALLSKFWISRYSHFFALPRPAPLGKAAPVHP